MARDFPPVMFESVLSNTGNKMERVSINNEKFIQEIYKRRSLWDQKSTDYLNRALKAKEWEAVSQEMNCTIEEVKNRWKLLKDSFNREVRNMAKNCSTSSKWAHFEQMSFLLKSNNSLLLPSAYLSQSLIEFDSMNTASNSFDNELSENSLTLPEEDTEMKPVQKKKLKTNYSRSHNSILTSTPSENSPQSEWNAVNSSVRPEHANEDYYFLMSLLPTFERMSPRQKMLVKIKMMQDVYEAAFADPRSQTNNNQSNDTHNYFDPVSSGS